ncbi:N6-adenosine-methyltransferase subunit METTL14 [Hypsizygus marmoreus]|uniref:N6-adenosine-methyltransferase subunit METTL14 n=1 Tax=Hypsizygus marmoreus TaxID=39966 RepID=A0A369JC35_HYPMA|nr:N6-adenosine-methyltransferase subunit METTL14 [Hypsizygus marmoreus]
MSLTATTTEIISSANELLAFHTALITNTRLSQHSHRRQLHSLHSPPQELLKLPLIPSPPSTPPLNESPPSSPPIRTHDLLRPDLPPAKRARVVRYANYVPEEETIRNDYSQRYVDAGEWPQNWVLGAEPEHRFEEYPKQQRLLNLKKASVTNNSLPPSYLSFSEMSSLQPSKFDVILLDPPFSSSFTWDHLQELQIPSLAGDPSFIFMWVGSGAGEGLERGREVLAKWGYRRCEDVVWVKTNKTTNKGPGTDPPTTSLLTRTKQHCLIGIRGTVRRSTDSWFVHCNVDTDVIFWEGDPSDPTRKPPEMYTLIENFCLGMRRLEIFGRPSSLRRGWVTVMGQDQDERLLMVSDAQGTIHVGGEEGGRATRWDRETWEEGIKERSNGGKAVVPMTPEIDALRPKSPFRPNQTNTTGQASGAVNPRFTGGARPGFIGGGQVNQGLGQNQMLVQPMMGMGMNALGLGIGSGMGVGVDEMMGAWNPMMGGMTNMNVGGMGNMNVANMGRMNAGGMNRMAMPMMGPMGMGGGGFGTGPTVFNGGAAMGWGDQGQFGMEGSWEGDAMMNAGVGGMGNGMNMNAMNMSGGGMGAGMGMGQWGSGSGGY